MAASKTPSARKNSGTAAALPWYSDVVGPKAAAALLAASGIEPTHNAAVKAMGQTMLAGEWKLNGETVVVSEEGKVLDGRRRLSASVLYDVEFPAMVVTGVKADAAITINSHKRRTTVDSMRIMRVAEGRALAQAALFVKRMATGQNSFDSGSSTISPAAVVAFAEAHPEIHDSIAAGRRVTKVHGLGPVIGAASHFLFARVDRKAADAFLDAIASPRSRAPAVRALKAALDSRPQHSKNTRSFAVAVLIKAWNAYRDGVSGEIAISMEEGERMPSISGAPTVEFPAERAALPPVEAAERRRRYRTDVASNRTVAGARIVERVFTPEEATAILAERNGPQGVNRPISAVKVAAYARDMSSGNWRMNGQTVKFSVSGNMIDGQHRMSGCVASGLPFRTLVVEGLADDAFETIDLGVRRTFGQHLREMGVSSPSRTEQAVAGVWRWLEGRFGSALTPTTSEALAVYEMYGKEIEASRKAFPSVKMLEMLMTETHGVVLHRLLSEVDAAGADRFMTDLVEGVNLSSTDPVHVLRQTLLMQGRGRGSRMNEAPLAHLVFGAWNMRRQGKTTRLKTFRLPPGAGASSIPTLV